jgi:hypothetical protein
MHMCGRVSERRIDVHFPGVCDAFSGRYGLDCNRLRRRLLGCTNASSGYNWALHSRGLSFGLPKERRDALNP